MSLPPTLFIDRIPNLHYDVIKLVTEYRTIEDRMEEVTNHGNNTLVQRKLHLIKDNIRSDILNTLTYTCQIIEQIFELQTFNSVNYRLVLPNTCYNWHFDTGNSCVHIPLITNLGCRFVYDTKAFFMPSDGSVYVVNNSIHHSFMNAGPEPRLHLTFENL
jgi:hypothetical protein